MGFRKVIKDGNSTWNARDTPGNHESKEEGGEGIWRSRIQKNKKIGWRGPCFV